MIYTLRLHVILSSSLLVLSSSLSCGVVSASLSVRRWAILWPQSSTQAVTTYYTISSYNRSSAHMPSPALFHLLSHSSVELIYKGNSAEPRGASVRAVRSVVDLRQQLSTRQFLKPAAPTESNQQPVQKEIACKLKFDNGLATLVGEIHKLSFIFSLPSRHIQTTLTKVTASGGT